MPYALTLDLHAPNQVKGNKAGRGSIYTISFSIIPPLVRFYGVSPG